MKSSLPSQAKEHNAPVTIGILAHVDAGKTTLAEAMLYRTGALRRIGRVDHGDAFLDTFALERKRGITIFSKQAQLSLGKRQITLMDTPGHVDFSSEAERTLTVLDYAILVISGTDGVQGHVHTLWRLLSHYNIPVFIFINKMDLEGCDKDLLLKELKEQLSGNCIDFAQKDAAFYEDLATGSEQALGQYLDSGSIDIELIRKMIRARSVFPCFFGSALKLTGIDEFLQALDEYLIAPSYPDAFAARVFKIARDDHGERLTYLKVTGGTLKVKTGVQINSFSSQPDYPDEDVPEKINQIRIYDGSGYKTADEVCAGSICAVTGLTRTRCGDALGGESRAFAAVLEPVLTYTIIFPDGCDIHKSVSGIMQLEEEEPQLRLSWKEEKGELNVCVSGQIQIEILKSLIKERFGLDVEFGHGSIIYKETINTAVEGVGHFEPLRHYAEVHLLLEPSRPGSGLILSSDCSEDMLDLNWQRLILTHLAEKKHTGVLTGSELTDVKITLKSGRAHTKHTEGGDFREATYRAVRQGLMQAESVLLEPYYSFRLEVPMEMTGRAMSDIQRMGGEFEPAASSGKMSILIGKASAAMMQSYPQELAAYSHGRGRILMEFAGYKPCHNASEVIEQIGYNAERDTLNPSSSVFCAHGSGFIVPWNEVSKHMHLESVLKKESPSPETVVPRSERTATGRGAYAADKELKEIFERTYGSGSFAKSSHEYVYHGEKKENGSGGSEGKGPDGSYTIRDLKEKYLLVDGYNIIFAWDELKTLANKNIDAARERLIEILCNYQAYKGMTLELIFDAYRVKGERSRNLKYHNLDVIFTAEGESADQYIEKKAAKIGRKYDVTVATSDRLEQLSIFSHGARRMSANELYMEIEGMSQELRSRYLSTSQKNGATLFDNLTKETIEKLEEIRRRNDMT